MLISQVNRRVRHFFKSGVVQKGFDHFLVMFPSALLIFEFYKRNFNEPIIHLGQILIGSIICTAIFITITKGKVPAYFGPSFSVVSATQYLITLSNYDPDLAIKYISTGYCFVALLLIGISCLYSINICKKIIGKVFPVAIIGPTISMIGLELIDIGVQDSGLLCLNQRKNTVIALFTLLTIILLSVYKRKIFKHISICLGICAGCILAYFINDYKPSLISSSLFSQPFWTNFRICIPILGLEPEIIIKIFLTMIPSAILLFVENLSRTTIIFRMVNNKNDIILDDEHRIFFKSLLGQGIGILICSFLGFVPFAIYAENIAVTSIYNIDSAFKFKIDTEEDEFVRKSYDPFSVLPLYTACGVALAAVLFPPIQELLSNLPKPVIGGMELFIFGIVSAPGIQLLVDYRINYKKVSNQILTASVLVAGLSGIVISLDFVELKGMSLGFLVGVTVNIILMGIKYSGKLNEYISFYDIIQMCLSSPRLRPDKFCYKDTEGCEHRLSELKELVSHSLYDKKTFDFICEFSYLEIYVNNKNYFPIVIKNDHESIHVLVYGNQKFLIQLTHDFSDIISDVTDEFISVTVNLDISYRQLKLLLYQAFTVMAAESREESSASN